VAVRQASDSFADVKLMSASVASGAREASSVTESRQAADSTKALARAEQSAFERKVQQAAQSVPTPPRIIPEQQQAGAAAPPASPSPLVARNRAAVMDAAADALESVPMAGRCYRLGVLTPGGASRIETFPDTIRLLDEPMPGRIDPSWRRATGAPGAELAWRMVDSVTAELRILLASDSSTVRFRVTPGTAPDVSGLSGVRAAMAAPVRCR
jgi:hypothetical protein